MKKLSLLLFLIFPIVVFAQVCDSLVPTYSVDFAGNAGGSFTTPSVVRTGYCCGTTGTERCVHINATVDSNTVAFNFNITGGLIPPGANLYQVDCATSATLQQMTCSGFAGQHEITFCKPGNNPNNYTLYSISRPLF